MDATISINANSRPALKSLADHGAARILVGLGTVAAFLAVWQIVGATDTIRSDLISYPSEVAQTAVRMTLSGELGANIIVSLQEFVQGFFPG